MCKSGLSNPDQSAFRERLRRRTRVCYLPEKTLAALTGHGVEVEARGLVTAHAADPRHVPIKLIGGQGGGTYNGGLHHCTRKDMWKRELSDHSMQKEKRIRPQALRCCKGPTLHPF